jgi:hypothetical protein
MWGPAERRDRQVEDLEKRLGFEDRVEVVNGLWEVDSTAVEKLIHV